jgi:hypothetical protein
MIMMLNLPFDKIVHYYTYNSAIVPLLFELLLHISPPVSLGPTIAKGSCERCGILKMCYRAETAEIASFQMATAALELNEYFG